MADPASLAAAATWTIALAGLFHVAYGRGPSAVAVGLAVGLAAAVLAALARLTDWAAREAAAMLTGGSF